MAIASLLLGGLAFFFMLLGMIFSMVPVAGAILSIGAPVVALFGVVTGGIAMSRASQSGESNGLGVAGLVVSVVAFLISLLFALTCGLCNACMSTAMLDQDPSAGGMFGPSPGISPGWSPSPTPPTPTVANPPAAPPPLPSGFAPDTTCDDVRPCCMAFTHADSTICDGVLAEARRQADPAEACRELASGWAGGLDQLGEPVPDACHP